MNQHDRKYYQFERTDPWKHIPWADEYRKLEKEEIYSTIAFVVCMGVLALFLFM